MPNIYVIILNILIRKTPNQQRTKIIKNLIKCIRFSGDTTNISDQIGIWLKNAFLRDWMDINKERNLKKYRVCIPIIKKECKIENKSKHFIKTKKNF